MRDPLNDIYKVCLIIRWGTHLVLAKYSFDGERRWFKDRNEGYHAKLDAENKQNDPSGRSRVLLYDICANSRKWVIPGTDYSIDEIMQFSTHRGPLKMIIPHKPDATGTKLYALADKSG